MSDLFVDNIKHQSSQGSGTITLGTSGEKIGLASGAEFSNITGQNYPAFYARKTGNQNLSRAAITKITTFTTDEIDTDSAFDGTTFTVPVAGKYMVGCQLRFYFGDAGNDGEVANIYLYKNGAYHMQSFLQFGSISRSLSTFTGQLNMIIDLAVDDTVEVYGRLADNSASGTLKITETHSFFQAYRIGA